MTASFHQRIRAELADIGAQGLTKPERVISSRQGPVIQVGGREVLNFCANNYLGLAGDERVTRAGIDAQQTWGAGTASVRFICGTLEIHKELERAVADYLGFEDSILFAAAFDANGGIFEPLFGAEDAIVSDSLNHASIIDGVRLCKARRYRFANSDMDDLETQLKQARADGAREIVIATDGVFSMDGYIAKLPDICELADKHKAMVVVDDSHATGFFGPTGRGTAEYFGVQDRVDIVDSTFGKALGGASGGFTSGKREIIDLLRNRARPYLFSNTLAPAIVGATIACIDRLSATTALRDKLAANTKHFRDAMTKAGFAIVPGDHPICPIMLGDAKLAVDMAARMLQEGIYVIGFCFPVVPKGKARIRVQISAAHEIAQLETAVAAFSKVGKQLGVIA